MTLTIPHPGASRGRVSRGVLAGVAATLVAVGGYQVTTNFGNDGAPASVVETIDRTLPDQRMAADAAVEAGATGLSPASAASISVDPNFVWPEIGGLPALPTTGASAQSVTPQPNPAASASIGSTTPSTGAHPGSLVR